MAISENEIAQVRNATDIVALISETVALKSYAAKVTPEEARRFVALRPMKTDL